MNFSKVYGRSKYAAVDDISFKVYDGEILGFAGLNGAGKTTTINTISGVLLPTSGQILVDGIDIVQEKPKASKNIGWVSEFPSFEQNVKPVHLMEYFAGFYNLNGSDAKSKIQDILNDVGLTTALNRKLRDYSQGMKKRFGLATAMLSEPKNFLLDEILNGLDPEGVNYVKKLALEFKRQGRSVLLSTHILGVLENVADRIIIVHKGKIIQTIAKDNMKNLGKPTIKLKTNRIDDNLMKILARFGNPTLSDDSIIITGVSDPESAAQELSVAVVNGGYSLSQLTAAGASLEEHFLELIGGSA